MELIKRRRTLMQGDDGVISVELNSLGYTFIRNTSQFCTNTKIPNFDNATFISCGHLSYATGEQIYQNQVDNAVTFHGGYFGGNGRLGIRVTAAGRDTQRLAELLQGVVLKYKFE